MAGAARPVGLRTDGRDRLTYPTTGHRSYLAVCAPASDSAFLARSISWIDLRSCRSSLGPKLLEKRGFKALGQAMPSRYILDDANSPLGQVAKKTLSHWKTECKTSSPATGCPWLQADESRATRLPAPRRSHPDWASGSVAYN